MTQLQQGLAHIVSDLTARNVAFALVGGLAVSALTAVRAGAGRCSIYLRPPSSSFRERRPCCVRTLSTRLRTLFNRASRTPFTDQEPLRQIAANSGVDGSIVVIKVQEGKDAFGFNAATLEYGDLVKAGVIDPTKVVRTALQNAASVSGLMLTTETLIAEKPKKEAAASGGGHGHDHGGGYED